MQRREAFVGFNEAPINFPPTFKYDVLRTIKPSKSSKWSPWKSSESVHDLSEIEEKETQEREDGEAAEECEEAASIASLAQNSKTNFEDDVQNPEPSPSHMVTSESAAEKPAVGVALDKVKSRWMRLLSSPRIHPFKQTRGTGVLRTPNFRTGTCSSSADFTANRHSLLDKPYHPSIPPIRESEAENEDEDRGVYDSSYKKRVPSWLNRIYQVHRLIVNFSIDRCDRILWKSTVKPDPHELDGQKSRNRIGQFFSGNIWPLLSPSRALSLMSSNLNDKPEEPAKDEIPVRYSASPPPSEISDSAAPLSRFVQRGQSLSSGKEFSNPRPSVARSSSQKISIMPSRRSFSAAHNAPFKPVVSLSHAPAKAMSYPPCPRTATDPSPLPLQQLPPHHVAAPSRWRFLPFLSRESPPITELPVQLPPRKGDIICLSYDTLDDRGMRRLEGRSDHRPVIGSYAIYI
jgi:hypothetical protein